MSPAIGRLTIAGLGRIEPEAVFHWDRAPRYPSAFLRAELAEGPALLALGRRWLVYAPRRGLADPWVPIWTPLRPSRIRQAAESWRSIRLIDPSGTVSPVLYSWRWPGRPPEPWIAYADTHDWLAQRAAGFANAVWAALRAR